MAIKQGFKASDGSLYVYQENTDTGSISASTGFEVSTSEWTLNLSTTGGAEPGVGFEPLNINPSTGLITITPGAGGVTIAGTLNVTGGMSFTGDITTTNSAASTAAYSLISRKNRSAGVITSGDDLGQIYFQGYDGTAYVTAASIRADSSGTIAANRVAGSIIVATHPDSASGLTPTDRVTIASTGAVTIATPDSGTGLTIGSGLTVTAGSTTLSALNSAGVVQTNSSGVLATSNGSNGQVLIGGGTAPTWAAITAGAGITVTNGANSISIATSGGTTWNEVVAASASMAVDNGYISNNAGVVTLTLPAVAVVGDSVRVSGKGAGGWLIAQNAGQTIFFSSSTTTTGVAGSLASTHRRDAVELVCVTANNDWNVISSIGNITVA
jgi:hypothetical protein